LMFLLIVGMLISSFREISGIVSSRLLVSSRSILFLFSDCMVLWFII
jgi:hypothetical protein